uniref:TIDP3748 n=1 Tax=Arundo donax TaxID=35708 RepID=A0A0A9F5M7_ARUDO
MGCQLIEHVIQERYPCAAVGNTSSIEVDLHVHICLLGHPFNLSYPRRPCRVQGSGWGAVAGDAGGSHSRRPQMKRETARPSGEGDEPTARPPQGFGDRGVRREG